MQIKPSHYARVLSPMGIYPAITTSFEDAVYVADDQLSFSVYKFSTHTRGRDGEDDSYSEVQWLNPAEVRLYGSLLLSFDVDVQYLSFYPHWQCEPIYDAQADVTDLDWLMHHVRRQLHDKMHAPDYLAPGFTVAQKNSYKLCSDIALPPIIDSSTSYDFRTDGVDYDLAAQVYDQVSLEDDLVIRGLGALVKAGMLRRHYQFLEEAICALFIAMEACLWLVMRRLKSEGNDNPSTKDAMDYILAAFNESHFIGEEGFSRWFEEYYDRRVMTLHPESRFGTVPHAPLYADDHSFLYRDMVETYRYLLCGFVHPRHFQVDKSRYT